MAQQAPYKHLRIEKRDGTHVSEVVLCRPDILNVMGTAFFWEIRRAFQEVDQDEDCRVAILRAEGRVFTAGLDLKNAASEMADADADASVAQQNARFYARIKDVQDCFDQVQRCRKPVIAAVHSACIGGGVDLVCACDIRVCSADAKFSVKETKIAMVADLGTLQRLVRVVGGGIAREMAFTGDPMDAQRAFQVGFVNKVLDTPEAAVQAARDLAASIASNSPLAVQGVKAIIKYSEEHTIQDGLDHVALWNLAFIKSEDLTESFMAFVEKRKPVFRNRL
eukprot:gnl/Hemi2/10065_TR3490_c0_g1_i1.p1 gnl/Hemi2/10065_TR3490_c0_g1~~gnl/Hemi2/10065_TR3490_c0_g1_i1.p1  ORF type:complete len:280 (-),score=78.18 gnl/Hemi2/10065_TR3490_c0_g1_i1:78-917(-)